MLTEPFANEAKRGWNPQIWRPCRPVGFSPWPQAMV